MLAEDNVPIRNFIKAALSSVPKAEVVFETASHLAARAWLGEHPEGWDLALVDLFLTEGNGFRILKDCANRRPNQKVVVMTNYAREIVEARVKAEGADAFFDKTSEFRELLGYMTDFSAHLDVAGDTPSER